MKQLILTFPHMGRDGDVYKIDQVVGSTTYTPGQILCKTEVQDLCDQTGQWKIIMKRNTETR